MADTPSQPPGWPDNEEPDAASPPPVPPAFEPPPLPPQPGLPASPPYQPPPAQPGPPQPPPPPPPPPAPEVIEIVEDEEDIEETVIESTETDQEEIVEIVDVVDDFEDVDVPFAVIEDVPLFPGCEKVAKSERRKCFQEQINKHIRKNFRYPEIAQEMGIQGRVYVNFIISKDGSITNIRMRGPDKNLEKEAKRIISMLPKMTPGKQRGRPVRVPFSIPISFRLQ